MTESFSNTTCDMALEQGLVQSLKKLDFSASRQIAVDIEDGVVRLRGSVSSYYTRQVFVQTCLRTPGVVAVSDEIRVIA